MHDSRTGRQRVHEDVHEGGLLSALSVFDWEGGLLSALPVSVFDWEVLLESVVGLQSRDAGILHLRLRLLGMQEALLWRLDLLRGDRLGGTTKRRTLAARKAIFELAKRS